jgi:nitrogen-specific signal transduction histidine kinase
MSYHPSTETQVSHELRIPLTGILGTTYFLSRTQLDTQQKYYLDTIQEAARKLLDLENKLYIALKTRKRIYFPTKNLIMFVHCLEQTSLNHNQKEYVQVMLISANRLKNLKQKLLSNLTPTHSMQTNFTPI